MRPRPMYRPAWPYPLKISTSPGLSLERGTWRPVAASAYELCGTSTPTRE